MEIVKGRGQTVGGTKGEASSETRTIQLALIEEIVR